MFTQKSSAQHAGPENPALAGGVRQIADRVQSWKNHATVNPLTGSFFAAFDTNLKGERMRRPALYSSSNRSAQNTTGPGSGLAENTAGDAAGDTARDAGASIEGAVKTLPLQTGAAPPRAFSFSNLKSHFRSNNTTLLWAVVGLLALLLAVSDASKNFYSL